MPSGLPRKRIELQVRHDPHKHIIGISDLFAKGLHCAAAISIQDIISNCLALLWWNDVPAMLCVCF